VTQPHYVDRAILIEFLRGLGAVLALSERKRRVRFYLVGETTQVFEGWREWTGRLEFAAEPAPDDREAFAEAVRHLRVPMMLELLEESPGDVIPLPAGYEARARPAGQFGALEAYHFDPYSVAFRLIARGDEPDYHAVLAFLQHGWLTVDRMNALLAELLPQFTSVTIQQDPAEFRRKFRALLQMWGAAQPRKSGKEIALPTLTGII
jgi:hypothetical protein